MENESIAQQKGACQTFIPQQWRKTKCKLCFHDIVEHKLLSCDSPEQITVEHPNNIILSDRNKTKKIYGEEIDLAFNQHERENSILPLRANSNSSCTEKSFSSQSNYSAHGNRSSSVDNLEDEILEHQNAERSNTITSKDSNDYLDETDGIRNQLCLSKRNKKSSPFYNMEKQDSFDEGTATPTRSSHQKKRTRSYRKNSSTNLLQFSAMMRSSNSSLCSYTSELTDGYSDYDYDVRSITDDTDDYAEITDVIDELEHIKPEIRERVQHERKISRSKIFDLERELEGQQDYIRATEIAKDRQIKSLQREIEGLKLELSTVKAHEDMLVLKSRLEIEGKANCIADLEQLVKSLQDEVKKLSDTPNASDAQHDSMRKELERAQRRISLLEDEKLTSEKKSQLAEDLLENEKQLLQVLHKQLSTLDIDYKSLQDRNQILEEKCKKAESLKKELISHEEKTGKLTKEIESLRQKVKRKERHIEDLEDDNAKMQQIKRDLESQLKKRELKIKKSEEKLSDLQKEVTKCNKEIADLTGENQTLEQVNRFAGEISDSSYTSQVKDGEQKFILSLQEQLTYLGSRVKELELENQNYVRETRELYESIVANEKQCSEYKEQVQDTEMRINKLRQENKHAEKKIELFKRKLQKCEKDRKRAINRQRSAEVKYAELQDEICTINSITTNDAQENAESDMDPRKLKMKLDTTSAKLAMLEGSKSFLESKVMSLEQKLIDRESEISYLHDSLERDSGAPSQDYDRLDVLERENVMLQTKVDDLIMENNDHREYINQLQEKNSILEDNVLDLTNKLDACTKRLKDVEEANHTLGREALRRTHSDIQTDVDASLSEIRTENKMLQEKLKRFDGVEKLVAQLESEVRKEQSDKQWYADENERLKVKLYKVSDKLESVEESNKQCQLNIRDLTNNNLQLHNDVKRLEQKLEIYSEMFGPDSTLYASLKRRSYQQHERDEVKIIENALSPLMEEIQEKDARIIELETTLKEKELTISALNDEVELWESNISAIFGEKAVNGRTNDPISPSGDKALVLDSRSLSNSSPEVEHARVVENTHKPIEAVANCVTKIVITPSNSDAYGKSRRQSSVDSDSSIRSSNGHIEVTFDTSKEKFVLTKQPSCDSSTHGDITSSTHGDMTSSTQTVDEDLTLSTEAFYDMLKQHENEQKRKDAECRSVGGTSARKDTPRYNAERVLVRSIEPLPTPKSSTENIISVVSDDDSAKKEKDEARQKQGGKENRALVEDMFEQLAQLEDLVSCRNSPTSTQHSPSHSDKVDEGSQPSSYRSSLNDPVDLSGLDELLAEVKSRRGSETQDRLTVSRDESIRRQSIDTCSDITSHSTKPTAIMPSIRTTKRRIIRLGGLNRSGSLDSTATRPMSYRLYNVTSTSSNVSNSTASNSLSNIPLGSYKTLSTDLPKAALTSNPTSISSRASIGSETENSSTVDPPFRRPRFDSSKFSITTSNNSKTSTSKSE